MITFEYLQDKVIENKIAWESAHLNKGGMELIVEKAKLIGQMELLTQLVKDF